MKRVHWRRNLFLFISVTSLLYAMAFYTPAAAAPSGLKLQFQSVLEALHEQYPFPGATAAYRLPNGTVEVVATGLADIEAETLMTPHSRMLAASIGKTFVGATAIALEQSGRLNLDEPIARWLSDRTWFSRLPNHESITLRQLLTHSAGLPDHVYSERFAQAYRERWQSATNPFSPDALIDFVLDQPSLFSPGEGWAYSDTGYILVGLIVEEATGHSYYQEVTQRFLEPLQLTLTEPSDRRELPGLAAGYIDPHNTFGLPEKNNAPAGGNGLAS